ncbi:MAG: type II toxin-antitoxin system YoeB family toxin [Treponema sp.]|jgi:Txe/YoeB family toxin of Txe-Axe toxin-antitoxin module|nr:type II toxin-antitoxin system YoeB family toxin [Treponema sp.]
MNDTTFAPAALAEYMEWQTQDRKTLRKINNLATNNLRILSCKGHYEDS